VNDDPIEMRIFNAMGQEVIEFANETPSAGFYTKTFSLDGLANGIYFLWFRTGETTEVKKLMVRKD